MVTAGRSVAEELFEAYLGSQHLRWDYEPQVGRWRPDYLVHHPGGQCVVEVKELRRPDPVPTSGYSPVPAIRDAMRRARNQLRGCKHLPTAIVLYSESLYRNVTPLTVASAAFGPGFQDARQYDRVEPWAPALRFSRRDQVPTNLSRLANPFLSRTDNRTISAVIVLARYRLDNFQLAVWRRLYERQSSGQQLPPGASFSVAAELQDTVPATYEFEGTIRLAVIENSHARIQFPTGLFRGPFDQRWIRREEWCMPSWIGATATDCYEQGVPFDLL